MTLIWICIALLLVLAELMTGLFVLLALALACFGTALGTSFGLGFTNQLILLAVLAGVLAPIALMKLRRRFSPEKTSYGTSGSGAYNGREFMTSRRSFDGAVCIRIKGDEYKAVLNDEQRSSPEEGHQVTLINFEGTVAIVSYHRNTNLKEQQQ